MFDQIDIEAEREAAAALRLRRLTGADTVRDSVTLFDTTARYADITTTRGYQIERNGPRYGTGRGTRRTDSLRAHDRIQRQFAGRRVVVTSPRIEIVTTADKQRREKNRRLRALQLEFGQRLQAMNVDRATALATLAATLQDRGAA